MTALLVGGDKLGNIPDTLRCQGIDKQIHWTGRKKKLRKAKIPKEADMIILFYDYLEHNIASIIKEQAKQQNIPCVFSKRAVSDLHQQLERCSSCNLKDVCKGGVMAS